MSVASLTNCFVSQIGVATEAARASVLLNTWMNSNDFSEAISWRYVAFPSGLLLNHPAVKSDLNLRLEHLPWCALCVCADPVDCFER